MAEPIASTRRQGRKELGVCSRRKESRVAGPVGWGDFKEMPWQSRRLSVAFPEHIKCRFAPKQRRDAIKTEVSVSKMFTNEGFEWWD